MNSEYLRAEVTQQIIDALESGNLPPWRKPFKTVNDGRHRNLISKKPYTGVNPLILETASQTHRFSSSDWATFQQWKKMGGQVKRRPDHVPTGKWGTQIVFTSPVTKKA
jgi:antirestriction protein ArdC